MATQKQQGGGQAECQEGPGRCPQETDTQEPAEAGQGLRSARRRTRSARARPRLATSSIARPPVSISVGARRWARTGYVVRFAVAAAALTDRRPLPRAAV